MEQEYELKTEMEQEYELKTEMAVSQARTHVIDKHEDHEFGLDSLDIRDQRTLHFGDHQPPDPGERSQSIMPEITRVNSGALPDKTPMHPAKYVDTIKIPGANVAFDLHRPKEPVYSSTPFDIQAETFTPTNQSTLNNVHDIL